MTNGAIRWCAEAYRLHDPLAVEVLKAHESALEQPSDPVRLSRYAAALRKLLAGKPWENKIRKKNVPYDPINNPL